MYEDILIYGKNPLERIVSVEIQDDVATIFRQLETGEITTELASNRFWILSPKRIDPTWVRLKGDLYYQYGKQYKDRETYLKARSEYRKYDIYSIYDPKEAFLIKDGYTYYKGLNPKDVAILSFDIETTGVNHDSNSKIILISNTFRNHNGEITRKLFSYDEYSNQGDMLTSWCNWVKEVNPSIICGHNIFSYDLPYMQFIADQDGIQLELGRDESPIRFNSYTSSFRIDGSREQDYNKAHIFGRELVDTYFLAIKYDIAAKKYESYGLKNIIKQEGLEVADREFYDASTIKDNYLNPIEFEKIKRYAEHDADDSLSLFDLMIAPYFYMTQSIPKSFQLVVESATGSQINAMMVRSYLQEMHSIPKASETYSYEGAISIVVAGIYSNCIRWDVQSMYPSIILENKLYDRDKDPKQLLYVFTKYFKETRIYHKKMAKLTELEYHKHMEQSLKIFANSLYGFCGAGGLNFNSPKCAEFITKRGREVLTNAITYMTGLKEDDIRNLQNN